MNNIQIIGIGIVTLIFLAMIIAKLISISKGKINILLDKSNFSPGETINGKIILNMKKPCEAEELTISLLATRKEMHSSKGKTTKTTKKVFESKQKLDSKKVYQIGEKEYPFKIKIPNNVGTINMGNETLNNTIKTLTSIFGVGSIKWELKGELNILGYNLIKSIQIYIN